MKSCAGLAGPGQVLTVADATRALVSGPDGATGEDFLGYTHGRSVVTRSTQPRFRRAELAHGADHILVPSATFRDDAGSSFTATFRSETALRTFLDMVLRYPDATSTVTMVLRPRGYKPPASALPEFLPSSLYFDVDQASGTAAAALLLVDTDGVSHQWLTQGDAGRDDVVLVMDPYNPEHATFAPDSVIPASLLRDAAIQWAFNDNLPPDAVPWRRATEDEVSWPVGASYAWSADESTCR